MIHIPLGKKLRFMLARPAMVWPLLFILGAAYFLTNIYKTVDFLAAQLDEHSPETTGVILARWDQGQHINGKDYFGYAFEYENPDPNLYEMIEWESYSMSRYEVGQTVPVVYLEEDTGVAKIKGSNNTFISQMEIFMGILLGLVGLVLLFRELIGNIRWFRIFKEGILAKGRFIKGKGTEDEVNGRRVYRLLFEFTTAEGKKQRAIIETHRVKEVTDEKEELLIYHKEDPSVIELIDDFPPYLQPLIRQQAEEQINPIV